MKPRKKYTPDEVSKLSQKKLDGLIARRVMGWHQHRACWGRTVWMPKGMPDIPEADLTWSSSTNWFNVGEVIGVLLGKGCSVQIDTTLEAGERFNACMYETGAGLAICGVEADTPQRAFAEAAVLVEQENYLCCL